MIAATVAVAGAVALASGGFALASQATRARIQPYLDAANASDGGRLDTGKVAPLRQELLAQVNVATVLASVAGALGGVAALEAPFVDWNGYAEWKPGRPAPVR